MGSMDKLSSNLENRIVRYDEAVDPEQLTAHPLNFRRHPVAQRKALRASIEGHGWVAPVIATVDGTVIDGHARVEEALSSGVTVPVVFVDMDDDEAGSMILRLDPIAAMASHDSDVLGELLAREEWAVEEQELAGDLGSLVATRYDNDRQDDEDNDLELPHDMFYETVVLSLNPEVASMLRCALASQPGQDDSDRLQYLLELTTDKGA